MPVDPQPPLSVYPVAPGEVPTARSSAPASHDPAEQTSGRPKLNPSNDSADITHEVPPGEFVLSYHFSEPGRHLYFQVIDAGTGRVIRQVPPAEVLNDERRVAEYLETQAKLHSPETVRKQS